MASINLTASLGFSDGSGDQNNAFPSIHTNFVVAWDLTKTSPQTLAFTNIKLDLGDYITKVAGPAVLEIQQYTKPFQEIVYGLQEPIPGLDQLPGQPVSTSSSSCKGIRCRVPAASEPSSTSSTP